MATDTFAVGNFLYGTTSRAAGTIYAISGTAPNYTFTYLPISGTFQNGEDIEVRYGPKNNVVSGEATLNSAPAQVGIARSSAVPTAREFTFALGDWETRAIRKGCLLVVYDTDNTADSLGLINEIKSDYEAHRVSAGVGGVHGAADDKNAIGEPDATDLASAYTLANKLVQQFRFHIGVTDDGVHAAVDTTNIPISNEAIDPHTLYDRIIELKALYNAHIADTSVHGAADTVNAVTTPDIDDWDTGVFMVESVTDEQTLVMTEDWSTGGQIITGWKLVATGAGVSYRQSNNKYDLAPAYSKDGGQYAVQVAEGTQRVGGRLEGGISGIGLAAYQDLNTVDLTRALNVCDDKQAMFRSEDTIAQLKHLGWTPLSGVTAGAGLYDYLTTAAKKLENEEQVTLFIDTAVVITKDFDLGRHIDLVFAGFHAYMVFDGPEDNEDPTYGSRVGFIRGKITAPRRRIIYNFDMRFLVEQEAYPEWFNWHRGSQANPVAADNWPRYANAACLHLAFAPGTYWLSGSLQFGTTEERFNRPDKHGLFTYVGKGRGITTIRGVSDPQSGLLYFSAEDYRDLKFTGITFDANNAYHHCVDTSRALSFRNVVFEDCEFKNATVSAFDFTGVENVVLLNCVVDGVWHARIEFGTSGWGDTKLFEGVWQTGGTTVVFGPKPGRAQAMRRTFLDGRQRSLIGPVTWAAANGVGLLGYDESASQTGTDKLYYWYLVPDPNDDARCSIVASDNPPTTGPAGYSYWELIWADREDSNALVKVVQCGSRFTYESRFLGLDLGSGTDGSPVSHTLTRIPESAGSAGLQLYAANGSAFEVYLDGSSSVFAQAHGVAGAVDTQSIVVPVNDSTGAKKVEYKRTVSGESARIYQVGWTDEWIDE